MSVTNRIVLLLTSPDEAMYDQYDSPNLTHAVIIVTIYAFFSSFNSFLSASIKSGSFGFSLITFFGSFLTTYLTWAFLTIVLHILAELLGSIGELLNAVAFVGLAAAPLIVTSFVSIFLTIGGSIILPNDPDLIMPKISLLNSLIGMAWGWPGILCYFGLKNAERLPELKAITIVLLVFFAMGTYEVVYSGAFD